MFHEENKIIIQQVANGFLVILPHIEEPGGGRGSEFKEMMLATKDLLKGIHEDPLLAKVEDTEAEFNRLADLALQVKKIKDLKENRMHIFKTFPEVLEFLSDEFKK